MEKARMRYEALLAENKLNESIRAAEHVFTFVSNLRRSLTVARQVVDFFSRISAFLGGLFGKRDDPPSAGAQEKTAPEEDVRRY